MRKVAITIIAIGVLSLLFYFIHYFAVAKSEEKGINDYIEDTSIVNIEEISEEVVEEVEVKEVKTFTPDYKAVLEIPKIDLKNGLVDSTRNFSSINYAISIDKNSSYPNEYGNFILYAHSGNSRIAFFKNLNKLDISDEVFVYYEGIKYKYKIVDKYEIQKTGKAKVVKPNNQKLITMITCISRTNKQVVLIGEMTDYTEY